MKPFLDYLEQIKHAPNETVVRELFVILAAKGFGESDHSGTTR